MTREELITSFLNSESCNYVLQLPTSYGKTKLALDKINTWYTKDMKILIAVPRNVLKADWAKEISKWGYTKFLVNITFTTYASIHKYAGKYDVIILDEGHHTSPRVQEILAELYETKHLIVLSATLKREHNDFFRRIYHPEFIRASMQDAIDAGTLPTPKLIFYGLSLNNESKNFLIEKNKKKGNCVEVDYSQRKKYLTYKGYVRIRCTQKEYYDDMSQLIEWYKKKASSGSKTMEHIWLHKANDRLKWLASQKFDVIRDINSLFKNRRMLIFCPSIKESEKIGIRCVHSKVGTRNLLDFNEKKIKHLAAVGMLDEGTNLTDCQIGVFQIINSSDRLKIQRIGRIMRHKKPILIFPYYIGTREEEIINKLYDSYDKSLCMFVKNLEEINYAKL